MQCVMCVRSPPPLCKVRPCSSLAVGVLLTRREKGPFPSVEHLSVLTVFVFACGMCQMLLGEKTTDVNLQKRKLLLQRSSAECGEAICRF